ncbi:MAG: group II intron reverse transcriptase/maturase [Rickettsiaceae bacterium]|nr:group II intron reverse transcriptase/maturase [Rickettsiaceae bacterium]
MLDTKVCPRPTGLLWQDNLENLINEGRQMMVAVSATSAPSDELKWNTINWDHINKQVFKLQVRIAKAIRNRKFGLAKSLQWILTHSFYAKLLAVKKVTTNNGAKTSGIDKIVWQYNTQKISAVHQLKKRGYKALAVRRVYIPKKDGMQRPLGIPSMLDRAMQALYTLALEPIAETLADKHSYGFRPNRSCQDAIDQCFLSLRQKTSSTWVLEGDIKGCFDNISHDWLLNNVPLDKQILRQWLKAGYLEKLEWFDSGSGTPQGGIISPMLANMTLDGLEKELSNNTILKDKVNLIRYADDFIITGASYELLKDKILPLVEVFLNNRGLQLSPTKTKITSIYDGFNFLGFNIRKFNHKLIIQPSKDSVKLFLNKLRSTVKSYIASRADELVWNLNLKVKGWCNYYRHVCSKATFSHIDYELHWMLWRWACRRYQNKCATWKADKHFTRIDGRIRFSTVAEKHNKRIRLNLFLAAYMPIKRHVKIKSDATPYDPIYFSYLERRKLGINYRSIKNAGCNSLRKT